MRLCRSPVRNKFMPNVVLETYPFTILYTPQSCTVLSHSSHTSHSNLLPACAQQLTAVHVSWIILSQLQCAKLLWLDAHDCQKCKECVSEAAIKFSFVPIQYISHTAPFIGTYLCVSLHKLVMEKQFLSVAAQAFSGCTILWFFSGRTMQHRLIFLQYLAKATKSPVLEAEIENFAQISKLFYACDVNWQKAS